MGLKSWVVGILGFLSISGFSNPDTLSWLATVKEGFRIEFCADQIQKTRGVSQVDSSLKILGIISFVASEEVVEALQAKEIFCIKSIEFDDTMIHLPFAGGSN